MRGGLGTLSRSATVKLISECSRPSNCELEKYKTWQALYSHVVHVPIWKTNTFKSSSNVFKFRIEVRIFNYSTIHQYLKYTRLYLQNKI